MSVGRDSASFLRENVEAFAVAVAMALVIRHFCVEAFRIPTDSMRPTLYGDEPLRRRQGDRILVDKFAWLVRDPRRYEVAVFQYPLNRSKNFIKRVLGLPGERLRIHDGDVWTSIDEGKSWRIAGKPEGVDDQLFLPFYPRPVDGEDAFRGHRNWDGERGWTVDEARRRFAVDVDAGGGVLTFRHDVPPYAKGGIGSFDREDDILRVPDKRVGDLRLSFHVEITRPGALTLRLREHGRTHELRLTPDGSRLVAEGEESLEKELPLRLEAGHEYSIVFANADGALVATIDGDRTRMEIPGETEGEPRIVGPEHHHHGVSIDATDLRAELRDIAIDRDVCYVAGDSASKQVWNVPPGHYMMLGDNSENSADSRRWTALVAKLRNGAKRPDGTRFPDSTVIRWEEDARDGVFNPGATWKTASADSIITIDQDVDGLLRRFRRGDAIDRESTGEAIPFVPRENLIGRAFSVFWPVWAPPLYSEPTRVKLIR